MQFSFDKSKIKLSEILSLEKKAKDYLPLMNKALREENYESMESSIALVFDNALFENVSNTYQKLKNPKLKYVLDIGIGGSNLGTKAVYDSIFGFVDVLNPDRFPKAVFADTNDPLYLDAVISLFQTKLKSEKEIIISIISKSGGTTETIANFELVYSKLVKIFPQIKDRIVVISDYGSKLWNKAKEKKLETLLVPKNVGGRYSVLSSVGLFPLLSLGIDIKELIKGAKKSLEKSLSSDLKNNPSFLSAAILFLSSKKGKTINDNFFFNPQFESLGKWYRQLMGESIGKKNDLDGKTVYAGITPTVSIGSTDLHSMVQLYLGGPRDKITTFVYAKTTGKETVLPSGFFLSGLVDNIEKRNVSEIMRAILEGVKIAYEKNDLPFMEVILPDVSEESLGYFLQFKMVEMMFLGKFLNINAFDQPNVEDYKVETKVILSCKKVI